MNLYDVFAQAQEPHTWRGFSGGGAPLAKQIGYKLKWNSKKPFGIFASGTMIHQLYQETLFKAGMKFDEIPEWGIHEPFEIVGHEQVVYAMINWEMRWSPIDTVVYYPETEEFEIWDWKSMGYGFKSLCAAKPENIRQVNFYVENFPMDNVRGGRLIYVNTFNTMETKSYTFDYDVALAKLFSMQLTEVDKFAQNPSADDWHCKTPCLFDNGYSKPCPAYCGIEEYCLELFRGEFDRDFADHKSVRRYLKKEGLKP